MPRRVLQLVSRDEPGGVQVLTQTVEAGFKPYGIEAETMALIGTGSPIQRVSHLVYVIGRVFSGNYDAIFSYHAAAGLIMALVGPIAGVRNRLSHLTAMPSAIRRRWRVMDKVAGASGGYTQIIANSAATAAAYSDFPPGFQKRIRTIPHGVVPVPDATKKKRWKDLLAMPPTARVLVAAGRLAPQKGYETVLQALPYLSDVHFVVAGEGPLRGDLERLALELKVRERFHLLGSVRRDELGDIFSIADVYVSPSTWETFGLAAVEAQMAQLPVVSSDLPVLREVLGAAGGKRTLMFHPVGDAGAFGELIERMLVEPPDAQELENVAKAARAHYGTDKMVQRYLEALQS
ncbi:glycosyltransferase family 4 protein [Rhizobium deserti]|nr:glycosyltransferase family 4 protein [Rhizobium deserti]